MCIDWSGNDQCPTAILATGYDVHGGICGGGGGDMGEYGDMMYVWGIWGI